MGSYSTVVVGTDGAITLPAEVVRRYEAGTRLTLIDGSVGLELVTQTQLRDRVRTELAGLDLVTELVTERRAAAAVEERLVKSVGRIAVDIVPELVVDSDVGDLDEVGVDQDPGEGHRSEEDVDRRH